MDSSEQERRVEAAMSLPPHEAKVEANRLRYEGVGDIGLLLLTRYQSVHEYSLEAKALLADYLREDGQIDQAGVLYDEVLRSDPESFVARRGRGYIRTVNGQCQEAEHDLQFVESVHPDDFDVLGLRFAVLKCKGNLSELRQWLLVVEGEYSSNSEFLPDLIYFWYDIGEFDHAFSLLPKVLRADVRLERLRLALALKLDLAETASQAGQFLCSQPNVMSKDLLGWAVSLVRLGRIKEARQVFRSAIGRDGSLSYQEGLLRELLRERENEAASVLAEEMLASKTKSRLARRVALAGSLAKLRLIRAVRHASALIFQRT